MNCGGITALDSYGSTGRLDLIPAAFRTEDDLACLEVTLQRHQAKAARRNLDDAHGPIPRPRALEEAMRSGAVAMFGEKYGSEVRVLSVGDGQFSMELCGGTHVRATGDIGSFKITADEAIASGVRRIRAVTGFDAFERFREDEVLIDRSLGVLKTQRDNLPDAIEKLQEELKRTRREVEELRLKIATGAAGNGSAGAADDIREIAGVKVLAKVVDGLDANGMRQLSDTLLARLKSGVVVLGRREEGKAGLIVRVSDDLKDRVRAGNVVKEIVPILGGKGGGRPDMAQGGGEDGPALQQVLAEVPSWTAAKLSPG